MYNAGPAGIQLVYYGTFKQVINRLHMYSSLELFFSSSPRFYELKCSHFGSRWRLKFNINTGRAILGTRRDGGSRAGALNCGGTARSAAICSAVRRANLKADAKDGVGQ